MALKYVNGQYIDDTALKPGQFSNSGTNNTGLVGSDGKSVAIPSIDYSRTYGSTNIPKTTTTPPPKPTVVAPAIKPTSTTLAPNDPSYKYRADTGELNTNYSGYSAPRIAPIGSVASLYTDEEQSMLDSINKQNEADAFGKIDPEAVYKKTLASYQSQIDAINNIYNDQLTQSRITNAPDYQARLDENRIQQLMGGFGSSAMGSAQTNRVQNLNAQDQASAEAIINDKRQTAIAAIYGQARKSSEDELTRKYQAQKEGSAAVLKEINERPERRKKALSTAVKTLIDKLGIEIDGFNDDEVAKLSKELGVTPDQFTAEWNSQASTYAAEANAAELKQRKAEADLAKTEKETSLLGTMTPYQAATLGLRGAELKLAQDKWAEEKAGGSGNFTDDLFEIGTIVSDIEDDEDKATALYEAKQRYLQDFPDQGKLFDEYFALGNYSE